MIINGLTNAIGARISCIMDDIKRYIVQAVTQTNGDEICTRFVCGLISDLANNIGDQINQCLTEIMQCL